MQGNNREAERHRVEDKIINMIDLPRKIKNPRPVDIQLRVPIMELITYRAARSGKAIQIGVINGGLLN